MVFINKTMPKNRPWELKKWKDGIISPSIIGTSPWNIKSTFRMKTMPGIIGGKIYGHLVLPYNLPFDSKLYVQLTNEEKVEHSVYTEDDMSGGVHYLYDNILTFENTDIKLIDGNWVVFIEFIIPYHTKGESDNILGGADYSAWNFSYRWILRAYTDRKSKTYFNIKFIVPIYRTKESDCTIVDIIKSKQDIQSDAHVHMLPKNKCIKILSKDSYKIYLTDVFPTITDIVSSIKSWCIGCLFGVILLISSCLLVYLFFKKAFGIYLCFCVFCLVIGFFTAWVPTLFDELETIMFVKETWFFKKCLYHRRSLKAISYKMNLSSWLLKATVNIILHFFKKVRGNSRIIKFPFSKIVRFASEKSGSRYVVKVYHQTTSDNSESYSFILANGIVTKSEANWFKLELHNNLE